MHEWHHTEDQAARLRERTMAQAAPSRIAQPRIWAVTSGKGGAGKSVVALNFALTLCEMGRSVLLVDADENLGKLDVMVGQSPAVRIPDVLSGSADLETAYIRPFTGLAILAGSSGSLNYPEITDMERLRFIDRIASSAAGFTDVVYDTGAGIGSKVVIYAAAADETIVVVNPEPVSVLDAYAVIKLISAKNTGVALNIVMNRSLASAESDDTAAKLQKAVRHFLSSDVRYLGQVPYDENVGRSVVRQAPLVRAYPTSPAAVAIRTIAQKGLRSSVNYHQQEMAVV